jgi:hypothetical protein
VPAPGRYQRAGCFVWVALSKAQMLVEAVLAHEELCLGTILLVQPLVRKKIAEPLLFAMSSLPMVVHA